MHVAAEQKDYEASIRWGEQAIELAPPDSNVEGEARLLIGEIQAEIGQYDAATAQLTKAVEILRALANDKVAALANCLLATIAAKQGRLDDAHSLLVWPQTLYAETSHRFLGIRIRLAEADIAMTDGDYEQGRRLRHEVAEDIQTLGDQSAAQYIRDLIANDPRDPANQR
jgi:tetratricopeptide (TPR) repeat protein